MSCVCSFEADPWEPGVEICIYACGARREVVYLLARGAPPRPPAADPPCVYLVAPPLPVLPLAAWRTGPAAPSS